MYCVSFEIGLSDYFGFGFVTLKNIANRFYLSINIITDLYQNTAFSLNIAHDKNLHIVELLSNKIALLIVIQFENA